MMWLEWVWGHKDRRKGLGHYVADCYSLCNNCIKCSQSPQASIDSDCKVEKKVGPSSVGDAHVVELPVGQQDAVARGNVDAAGPDEPHHLVVLEPPLD